MDLHTYRARLERHNWQYHQSTDPLTLREGSAYQIQLAREGQLSAAHAYLYQEYVSKAAAPSYFPEVNQEVSGNMPLF
jgi:hypothetical protein